MLRAKKTSNTNTSFSRKLVQKITVSIEKAFTSYALCKMLLYFEHRVLNIELEREGTKKKAQNGKSKSVCPRYFARHCIPACALSSVRLRKCRVPFVDTSVFFSRISVTRLFVKYDSSFSLWRWWRRNKYRQTRIFIKLQRDTNTCKMSACRIKIPQKRQTKSEDASLEPDDRSLFDRPNGSSGVSETAITDTETIEDLSLKWKLQVFGLNWLSWKMGHAVHR